jgi:hypothetical protein
MTLEEEIKEELNCTLVDIIISKIKNCKDPDYFFRMVNLIEKNYSDGRCPTPATKVGGAYIMDGEVFTGAKFIKEVKEGIIDFLTWDIEDLPIDKIMDEFRSGLITDEDFECIKKDEYLKIKEYFETLE